MIVYGDHRAGADTQAYIGTPIGDDLGGDAASLSLTDRAVEKHINSIFSKLGLSEEPDTHRRVKATLVYLSQQRR